MLESYCESCEPCFIKRCKTSHLFLPLGYVSLTVVIGLNSPEKSSSLVLFGLVFDLA